MDLIAPSAELLNISHPHPLEFIEEIARTCYHSEAKSGSAAPFVVGLIKRKHFAMIEFVDITVRFTISRAMSHELVRHRLASFAQESQRWIDPTRFGPIKFIDPVDITDPHARTIALSNFERAEQDYLELRERDVHQQFARDVLPNATATILILKANLREWRHIITLRTASDVLPALRRLMNDLTNTLSERVPIIFDDLAQGDEAGDQP